MATMEITTVIGCRMSCSYCPQKTLVNKYVELSNHFAMTLDGFKKCIDKIPNNVNIVFAGMSEPWLNKNCTEMVLYAHKKGHTISVFTTLYNVTEQDLELMKDIGFKHFCIHFPDNDGVMKLNVTDSYIEVLKKAIKIPNMTCMVIGKLHQKIEEVIGNIGDGSKDLVSRAGNVEQIVTIKKKGKIKCTSCGPDLKHNVLMPNGDVVLCCMDYGMDHILGNLNDCSYEDLFNGEEYKKVIQGLNEDLGTICRKCEISAKDD
jgi:radical SAM protein with 4Fe4S-binding SPASM domain